VLITRFKILLHDRIYYYRVLPFLSLVWERFEKPIYLRQKQKIKKYSERTGTRAVHLFLVHGRGGGVDKHVEDVASKLEAQGTETWVLHFQLFARKFVLTRGPQAGIGQRQIFLFPLQYAEMVVTLQSLGFAKLHIHHTGYLPYYFLQDLQEFAGILGIPYDYVMHDFIALCPRVHLVDGNFRYCGMPKDVNLCNACVKKNGFLTIAPYDVGQWRSLYHQLLQNAAGRMAPSYDTAQRHQQILGDMPVHVVLHDNPVIRQKHLSPKAEGQPYTIAVVGRIHRHKGADVVLACAQDALKRDLPLHFMIIGDSIYGRDLAKLGAEVTGVYREEELPLLLQQSGCSLVFLPSVWPETFSYTLSHVWENEYFPVVFDIGAPAERIRAANNGMILPLTLTEFPAAVNDALLKAAKAQHQ